MVTLEQVKLLENKVARAIDYVKNLTEENTLLKGKLAGYQQRIDELEVLIRQFKEDQSRIEDGILSALDRLNQFEDAIEKGVSQPIPEKTQKTNSAPKTEASGSPDSAVFSETSPADDSDAAIMAALEAEESSAKAKTKESRDQSSELDIF